MEAASQYRERVYERSPNDFDKWNEVVAEVKPYVKQLVSEKISEIIRANSLPKIFLDTVEWDILHLCMESEFAEVYPPGFYASQAYWYAKGHFPCGWQGSFPRSGKLLIY